MPTPEQRQQFAARLRERRGQLGWSGQDLADRLMQYGATTTRQAVSEWERGKSAPRRETALLLDVVIGEQLSPILGYAPSDEMISRLDDLERRVRALEDARRGDRRTARRAGEASS